MVNLVDTERLLKTIIAQFCDQNFKFTLNLKILGSIHVVVDNAEVLTCLLDEKYFKPTSGAVGRGVKPEQPTPPPLNLVTTLNQLSSQAPSSLSSKSTSSSSSTCSSSSYTSDSCSSTKHNKRKRFVPRGLLSTAQSPPQAQGGGEDEDGDEDEEDVEAKGDVAASDVTPQKRGKMVDESDEQAAATTLSLISASKMLMAPQLLASYHHHQQQQFQMHQPNQQTQQQFVPTNSQFASQQSQQLSSLQQPVNAQSQQQHPTIMKPKSKYIRYIIIMLEIQLIKFSNVLKHEKYINFQFILT